RRARWFGPPRAERCPHSAGAPARTTQASISWCLSSAHDVPAPGVDLTSARQCGNACRVPAWLVLGERERWVCCPPAVRPRARCRNPASALLNSAQQRVSGGRKTASEIGQSNSEL